MKTDSMEKQIPHNLESAQRKIPDRAIISEKVLAREWLLQEEEAAWSYL